MLKLKRRGKAGIYQIVGTVCGSPVRESTGTNSEPHAQVILAKRQAEILDRHTWGEKRTAIFAEAVEHYLNVGGEARFLGKLLDRWGAWRISEITDVEVARGAHELYPGRSAAYHVRAVYTPVQACLRAAEKAGLCPHVTFTKPKIKRKPVVFARDDWFQAVLPACQPNLAALLVFISTTGARVQEACSLTREDLDFGRMIATLRNTKTSTSREAIIIEVLRGPLEALARQAGPNRPVFGLANRHSVNQAIKRVCKRVKAPYLSSHKVGRHSFAARLLHSGQSAKGVQDAGGWASPRMVMENYGHMERRQIDSDMRRVGGTAFEAIPLGNPNANPEENAQKHTQPVEIVIDHPLPDDH